MPESLDRPKRTVVIATDDHPCPVVFEMYADTVELAPWGELRLVVSGPESASLRIGYGANGVSVFRDEELTVEVFDSDGNRLDISGF